MIDPSNNSFYLNLASFRLFVRNHLLPLVSIIIIPAFLYSKAIITFCFVFYFLSSLLFLSRNSLNRFVKSWEFSLFFFLFLMVVLSGFNSENFDQWIHHVTIKLPFAFVPLAFYSANFISEKLLLRLHLWLIAVLFFASVPVITQLFDQYFLIFDGMSRGHPIPTPLEHVKYSMMNAYGFISALIIVWKYKSKISKFVQYGTWFGAFWLFLFMHLLSVRTGLVIVYTSLFILTIQFIYKRKFKNRDLIGILTFLVLGIVAFNTMPFLKQKISYMRYDYQMYKEGRGNMYSDSDRRQSYTVGTTLFCESPLFGVGIGDLKDRAVHMYRTKFGRKNFFKYPHNEFLFILAGTGAVGFILFLIGFYGPLFSQHNYEQLFLFYLYLNYSLSFLVENSLERSFSLAFFLFFALAILSSKRYK